MKAICKQPFTAAGKSHKPGDELECSPQNFKKLEWHGYVVLPEDMLENKTEGAADEGGSKSDDESSEGDGDVSESKESSPENETE